MRNKSLDAGKAMAAFGVVFIHVSFPGQTGQIIKALARSAVPFFFMVSGYFCYYNRRNTDRGKRITDKIPAKVQHILTLLAFAVLFYFLWESAMHLVEKEAIGPWLQEMVKKEHLKELFRYNSTSQLKPHLWFLPALIYCYILDYFIEKLHLGKLAYLSHTFFSFHHKLSHQSQDLQNGKMGIYPRLQNHNSILQVDTYS